jgi:2-dehydropantoate 2-reductase
MRFAVFGAGGVGGYFGGRLAEAGHSVGFLARGAHLEAIRARGLAVESVAGDFRVDPAEASDRPAEIGPVDAVLVCVKAWQVADAARAMGPLLGPATVVLPLENGVEAADTIGATIGSGRVLGGLCRIVAYRVEPGRIRHAGVPPSIDLGERDGRPSARVEALREALAGARGLTVRVPADIEAAIWEKFLFIAPFSAVGAATGADAGAMRTDPGTRARVAGAMEEVAALARARGVAIRPDAVARTLGFLDALPPESTASMQRDLLEGRPSELEAQTGAVVRMSRAAGLAAPVHEALYRELLPLELRARAARAEPQG